MVTLLLEIRTRLLTFSSKMYEKLQISEELGGMVFNFRPKFKDFMWTISLNNSRAYTLLEDKEKQEHYLEDRLRGGSKPLLHGRGPQPDMSLRPAWIPCKAESHRRCFAV